MIAGMQVRCRCGRLLATVDWDRFGRRPRLHGVDDAVTRWRGPDRAPGAETWRLRCLPRPVSRPAARRRGRACGADVPVRIERLAALWADRGGSGVLVLGVDL